MQTYLVLCLTVVPPTSFHFNMSSSLTLNEVSLTCLDQAIVSFRVWSG